MGFMYTIRARKVSGSSPHEWEIRFSGLAGGPMGGGGGKGHDAYAPPPPYFNNGVEMAATPMMTPAESKGLEGFLTEFPKFVVTKEYGMVWKYRHNSEVCKEAAHGQKWSPAADPVCSTKVIGQVQRIVNYLVQGRPCHCQFTDASVKDDASYLTLDVRGHAHPHGDVEVRSYYWWTLTVN